MNPERSEQGYDEQGLRLRPKRLYDSLTHDDPLDESDHSMVSLKHRNDLTGEKLKDNPD